MRSSIENLQEWYLSQCDQNWEHMYGIKIETLDNPGWALFIDLRDTELNGVEFSGYSYGLEDEAETSNDNWLICRIEKGKFTGFGGPQKLEEMINIFLSWAESSS